MNALSDCTMFVVTQEENKSKWQRFELLQDIAHIKLNMDTLSQANPILAWSIWSGQQSMMSRTCASAPALNNVTKLRLSFVQRLLGTRKS